MARAAYAAGFRKGDLVHCAFSYHLTPAGSMVDTAAHALGCAVIPAGVGQTDLQLETYHSLNLMVISVRLPSLRFFWKRRKKVARMFPAL